MKPFPAFVATLRSCAPIPLATEDTWPSETAVALDDEPLTGVAPLHAAPCPPTVKLSVGSTTAATVAYAVARPKKYAVTGDERLVVVPSPSWPKVFRPQHFTEPRLSPHEKYPPED